MKSMRGIKHMKISLIEHQRISVDFFPNQNLLRLFMLSLYFYLLRHMRTEFILCRDVLEIGCLNDCLVQLSIVKE